MADTSGSEEKVEVSELNEKIDLLRQGLPIDWLTRAHKVKNLETMIHLANLQERWGSSDFKVIAKILQDHHTTKGDLLPENNPPALYYRRRNAIDGQDPEETVIFIRRLMALIKKETVVWDREGDARHGFHRPMRQAWCNISLKMGGWGTIQHVQMLKSIYRRKRDQYNGEFLRGHRKNFQYTDDMSFLSKIVERHTPYLNSQRKEVDISDYVAMTCPPDLDYATEIANAPPFTKKMFRRMEEMIEDVRAKFGDKEVAEYMSKCLNDLVQYKERHARKGLEDNDWVPPSRSANSLAENEDGDDEDDETTEDGLMENIIATFAAENEHMTRAKRKKIQDEDEFDEEMEESLDGSY